MQQQIRQDIGKAARPQQEDTPETHTQPNPLPGAFQWEERISMADGEAWRSQADGFYN